MLPPFNERGDLPAGIYPVPLAEIRSRLGESETRRPLMRMLRRLYGLAARTGHLERFLVFGSFVTSKEVPGDLDDVALLMAETFRVEEAPRESRALFSHADADALVGASVFWIRRGVLPEREIAAFLDFWQTRRDGTKRGIVEITS